MSLLKKNRACFIHGEKLRAKVTANLQLSTDPIRDYFTTSPKFHNNVIILKMFVNFQFENLRQYHCF